MIDDGGKNNNEINMKKWLQLQTLQNLFLKKASNLQA